MLITDKSVLVLNTDTITVRTIIDDDSTRENTLKYVEYPELRDIIRNIVSIVVSNYGDELFVDICGRCGKCCYERPVLVTSQEIQQISLFLNIYKEKDFRKEYIEPASSWNENDGLLKKTEGHCIFLNKGSTGCHSCKIHPVRPHLCAVLEPTMDICEKEPRKLKLHLEMIQLAGDDIEIKRTSGEVVKKELEETSLIEAIKELKALIVRVEEESLTQQDKKIIGANQDLNVLRKIFFEEGFTDDFKLKFGTFIELIEDFQRHDVEKSQALDFFCRKVTRMLDYIREDTLRLQSGTPLQEEPIEKIIVHREAIEVTARHKAQQLQHSISYRDNPQLNKLARQMVEVLATSGEPLIQEALWHTEDKCFLCGECCRCYRVEITPYDFERIAEQLKISEAEMWDKYLEPGEYSWNDGMGMLIKQVNKQEKSSEGEEVHPAATEDKEGPGQDKDSSSSAMPAGSLQYKRGLSLTSEPPAGEAAGCIFLKSHGEGHYCCSIYEARPEICRQYSAYNRPCQKISLRDMLDTHKANIIYIEITNEVLYLTTRHTIDWNITPVIIYLRENYQLRELYHLIKYEIKKVISSLCVSRESE